MIGIAIIDSIFLFGIKPAELLKEYIENKNARKQEAREQRLKQRSLKIEDSVSPYVKEEKPKKLKLKENKINIWAYTGFIYEDLIKDQIWLETLKHIDVLVDGPFIFKEYDPLLKFRGSKNQRIIDVKQSLENNKIIEVQL